jgi:hypothetical protein
LLEQGRKNNIRLMTAREAIPPLIGQFCCDLETEEEIRTVCGLLDAMLRNHPVWKFVNLGDDASTELLRHSIAGRTGDENGTV